MRSDTLNMILGRQTPPLWPEGNDKHSNVMINNKHIDFSRFSTILRAIPRHIVHPYVPFNRCSAVTVFQQQPDFGHCFNFSIFIFCFPLKI